MHICWGLSSEPVAYESVPRDFLSLSWAQPSSPSFCSSTPLHRVMEGRLRANAAAAAAFSAVGSLRMDGGSCCLGAARHPQGQVGRVQVSSMEPGPSALSAHVPSSSSTPVRAAQSPAVHSWPSFSGLGLLEGPGPLLKQLLPPPTSYVKLQVLFLQHPGGAWPRQRASANE